MTLRTFAFNKLVRSKMYDSIISKGAKINVIKIKTRAELINCFKQKLLEEVQEVKEAQNDKDLLEELADCADVISGFIKALSVSKNDFEEIRQSKYNERGGFENPVMVGDIAVSSVTTDPDYYKFFIEYCMASATKYPEISYVIESKKNSEDVV